MRTQKHRGAAPPCLEKGRWDHGIRIFFRHQRYARNRQVSLSEYAGSMCPIRHTVQRGYDKRKIVMCAEVVLKPPVTGGGLTLIDVIPAFCKASVVFGDVVTTMVKPTN